MSKKHLQIKTNYLVDGNELAQYASIKCDKPQFVTTRSGIRIAVPCGQCIACLRKRRNSWSIRLDDESNNPRCVAQFGITLTYKPKFVPYLRAHELFKKDYTYTEVSKGKYLLNVRRGCSAELLRTKHCIGLAYSKDIEDYIKRLRKQIDDNYPYLFIRYFISSDYGEIDGKRCGLPHYHGIIFVFANTLSEAENFRRSPNYLSIIQQIKEWSMDKWHYSDRLYDKKKNIYFGKDYHDIDKGYTSYLSKYINRYQDTGALGRQFVDTRIFCSRQNPKRGLGSIGFDSYKYNNSTYDKYILEQLDTAVKYNVPFKPSILNKPLNRAYRQKYFEQYFGFKMSRFYKYIEMCNIKQKIIENTTISRKEDLDPNDPFDLLYIDTITINKPHIIKAVNPLRRRSSIIRPPKSGYTEEYDFSKYNFNMNEICAFCRYKMFQEQQINLYLQKFKGTGIYRLINNKVVKTALSDRHQVINARKALKDTKDYIKKLLDFATTYAKYHELTNSYTDY